MSHGDVRTIFSDTLPSRRRSVPVTPVAPQMIKSAPISGAIFFVMTVRGEPASIINSIFSMPAVAASS